MLTIKHCKCGKPANQLVIIKGYSLFLCAKHTKILEKLLGEKLEPLTTKYYEARTNNLPEWWLRL